MYFNKWSCFFDKISKMKGVELIGWSVLYNKIVEK
jgi:hypothetical protein